MILSSSINMHVTHVETFGERLSDLGRDMEFVQRGSTEEDL